MNAATPLPAHLRAGPFTVQDARDANVSPKRLRGRDLQSPFHGIRVEASATLALAERAAALQKRLPEQAFFCGVTAAALLGVPLPRRWEECAVLHVGVPARCVAPAGRGVKGHVLQLEKGDVGLRSGIRLASPERVWCELGAILALPDLVAAGDYLIRRQRPLSTRRRLADAVAVYRGRRGLLRLREALPLLSDRSESRKESQLRVIMVQAGLAGLQANWWITTSGGYRYRADLAFPDAKVAIEYQSDYHRDPAQFRADMTRISRLQADGWTVVQINADDLRSPEELVRRIRRYLAAAART